MQLAITDRSPATLKELSDLGEGDSLFDAWGTPIRLMQIGEHERELRSAGEDRKLDTEDDLFFIYPVSLALNL